MLFTDRRTLKSGLETRGKRTSSLFSVVPTWSCKDITDPLLSRQAVLESGEDKVMDGMSHRKILLLSTAETGSIYGLLRLLQENRLMEHLGSLVSVRISYLSVIVPLNTCLTVFQIARLSWIMCPEFSNIAQILFQICASPGNSEPPKSEVLACAAGRSWKYLVYLYWKLIHFFQLYHLV